MSKFRLKFGIDVDDILFQCNEYAVTLANREYDFAPPLSINEIKTWNQRGDRSDIIFKYYSRPEFYRNHPLMKGAKEFIRELCRMGEVFFITATSPEFMSIRAQRLMKEFPEVPKENIIISSSKNLVKVDVLLDDGAHNILASESAYPVLMRRPWNSHMTGCLAVNNYEEFLTLIRVIAGKYQMRENSPGGRHLIALVGPSASGKTALMNCIIEHGLASKIRAYTTRKPRKGEAKDAYYFVDKETFLKLEDAGVFFETTRYAGECYGSRLETIDKAIFNGNVVMVVDICGAIALKQAYPENALLCYIDRPKADLLGAILDRDCSNRDKVNRILSLEDEEKNEALCDIVIRNDGSIKEMFEQLVRKLEDF